MADRCTLHVSKLDDFKAWCDENGIAYRAGKGDWQVLQVKTQHCGWQVIFCRADMLEHFTLNDGLVGLVKKYLRERKET